MTKLSPKAPDWVANAPVQIRQSRTISATPAAVWAVLSNNEGWVDWFPGFRAARFTTEAPHGVGSVRLVHQDQFRVQEEITTWSPDQAWAMTVTEINVPVIKAMAETVELIERAETTELIWHIGVQIARWARPVQPLLVKKSRRQLQRALEQLEELTTV